MNFYREKLLHTIMFFAQNVEHNYITKIFKLLQLFDFEHTKRYGIPSIGLKYSVYPLGPVPAKLYSEIGDGNVPADFSGKINIDSLPNEYDPRSKKLLIKATDVPDMEIFSENEEEILNELVKEYKYTTCSEMSELSHAPDSPWSRAKKESGEFSEIDYKYALNIDDDKEYIFAIDEIKDHFETVRLLNIEA